MVAGSWMVAHDIEWHKPSQPGLHTYNQFVLPGNVASHMLPYHVASHTLLMGQHIVCPQLAVMPGLNGITGFFFECCDRA